MSDFFGLMKQEQAKTEIARTDNGALAYASSGHPLIDFNFAVSSMRDADPNKILDKFVECVNADHDLAVKYLFYLGDIREGIGERRAFRICLNWVAEHEPRLVEKLFCLIPEYNRWDSVFSIWTKQTERFLMYSLRDQIEYDLADCNAGQGVSLLAKWMPSEKSCRGEAAKKIIEAFGWTPKRYRQTLSKLRSYLDVVEVKTSANQWGEIDYSKVPSRANSLYSEAFLKHDGDRRKEFLNKVLSGEKAMNANVSQPHEIIKMIRAGKDSITVEAMWQSLPKFEGVDNMLVVRDGSGSMTWSGGSVVPMDVATALAIYVAENNVGMYKDKFITFSDNPRFVDLSNCQGVVEKYHRTMRYTECASTDIEKTMMLVLDTAVANNVSLEEMPGTILIISDMEFNMATTRSNKTLFETIADRFRKAGYFMPKIVFWNVAAHKVDAPIPMQRNDRGVLLLSGFSTQLMRMVMSHKLDPYEALVEILNSDRYKPVQDALNS